MATKPSGKKPAPAPEQAPNQPTTPANLFSRLAGVSSCDLFLEAIRMMADGSTPKGNESTLVRAFLDTHASGLYDESLPWLGPDDTIASEFSLRFGRADVVVFHQDGSATVIEAKDGAKGYNHVVSGIGQCSLYAAQLALGKVSFREVRRALMWSSTGRLECDAAIEDACCLAGVIAMPYPDVQVLSAYRRAAESLIYKKAAPHGCP